jgi:hypothetical protein
MLHLYSILLVTSNNLEARIIVCQTIGDHKDVLRHVKNAGHCVSTIACCEGDFKRFTITLNDYSMEA